MLREEKTKRLIDFTGEELVALLLESGLMISPASTTSSVDQKRPSDYAYGIAGLANLLRVSTTTAQSMKNKGYFNGCFFNTGRKLVFDKELVMNQLKSQANE